MIISKREYEKYTFTTELMQWELLDPVARTHGLLVESQQSSAISMIDSFYLTWWSFGEEEEGLPDG